MSLRARNESCRSYQYADGRTELADGCALANLANFFINFRTHYCLLLYVRFRTPIVGLKNIRKQCRAVEDQVRDCRLTYTSSSRRTLPTIRLCTGICRKRAVMAKTSSAEHSTYVSAKIQPRRNRRRRAKCSLRVVASCVHCPWYNTDSTSTGRIPITARRYRYSRRIPRREEMAGKR